ncbi:UV DNA damage repair endonuclease UvsE [Oceanirhabdus sp. W0125-5]|uniref:UV DNA damage repair endonuclease UvsE n=1 Tax=Oceanirhabdus sp. W0125-5 TaxID=2999116 RepID=UPI0022F32336|nr:UV DNA damage repair endonuclease UvsE [Oceanirhabdus sp. W0125-5]WBW98238.1 UV DNA damage repair endonuclease UvsE [Oceanirhabdus sp. W0125-5]
MKVRLGYVAIALRLPKVTSSSTVTYRTYSRLGNEQERLNKLKSVTLSNLNDLAKILEYNKKNNIHFYRITSKLVPLATHPEVKNWDYRKIFKIDFESIGELINSSGIRVDTHPDQFNVINSVKEEVFKSTIRNLIYHVNFFEDINYKHGKMVIHVGSSQGGKEKALERFKANYERMPSEIKNRLMLENDDKTFTAEETLGLCEDLNLPMVLDVHHYHCNHGEKKLEDMLNRIINTWEGEFYNPKFHFSSPKEGGLDRKHADYIDGEAFIKFIEKCALVGKDIDIMLEAKKKDLALYDLAIYIRQNRPEWDWIDTSTFEVR